MHLVFDHVLTAHGDNGESAYPPRADLSRPQDVPVDFTGPIDVHKVADDVVARILIDPDFATQVARQLQATRSPADRAAPS